jgi:hypothetical protein
MGFMFIVIIFLVVAFLILNGAEIGEVKKGVLDILGQIYPKIKVIA